MAPVNENAGEGKVFPTESRDRTILEEIQYYALLGGLIELGAGGSESAQASAKTGSEAVVATSSVLGITPYDVNDLVHEIPEGHSGVVVLFEHTWASHLHEATVEAGGMMLGQAMIQPEGLVLLGQEMEAALEAAVVVEAAQLVELAAIEEVAEVVALSEAVQEEAARRAIAALIAAEMIEEAAIEDATQVGQ